MSGEFVIDFPTLGDLGDAWIVRHCRVPQGFTRGKPFQMADWQFWCHANRYRVRLDADFVAPEDVGPDRAPVLNQAFTYRTTLIVAPQKTGKGPYSAAQVAFEAVGPSVFAGWAEGGEVYRCREHGCSCGWGEDRDDRYVFQPGEPMGMRHPSPLIQVTANSADQAENIYGPLRAMIKLGPLSELLAVREDFIRILGLSGDDDLDRIDVVTASARSRLGNPISDAEQDEAGLYTVSNKMISVADTQSRGAAGMGGRVHLTTNAWDPTENSHAQQIFEAHEPDLFVFYRDPDLALRHEDGSPLRYSNAADRHRIHEYVYEGSWWVNLKSIEAEAAALAKKDPTQAERFFGNRRAAGAGHWMPEGSWEGKQRSDVTVEPRTAIAVGFDGSDNDDFTGLRAERLEDLHQFTPTFGDNHLPSLWDPRNSGGRIPRSEVMVAFREIAREFRIVRGYCDPFMWETEIDELAAEFGEKTILKWNTTRIVPMHAALERLRGDVTNPDSRFSHDGDEQVRTHIYNAVVRNREMDPLTRMRRYILGKPAGEDHRKIDYAMSSVLAHEAALDAIADGALTPAPVKTSDTYYSFA